VDSRCRLDGIPEPQFGGNVMLQLTDTAAVRMHTALAQAFENGSECFRIVVTKSQVQVVRDEERPEDVIYEHEGRVVLVLDAATAEFLKDCTIKYDEATSTLVFA
jgi:Fe-S cluster assembly iron-binding protein IscA